MRRRFVLGIALVFGLTMPNVTFGASPVTLKTTWQKLKGSCHKLVVYDLPEPGREKALKALRTPFPSGWDFVDLATIPEAQRASRLGAGFVLVTTFQRGGSLLEGMLKKVGVEVPDPDHVVVRGAHLEAKNLRMLFVGDNPFGPRPCIVLVARSGEAAPGVARLLFNNTSGFIQDGDVMIDRLMYTENFASFPRSIPLDEALADVATFFAKITEIHPDPLHSVTADAYIAMKRDTIRRVVQAADPAHDNVVRIGALAAILHRAVAFFGDGHTTVHTYSGDTVLSSRGEHFPPFVEDFDNGRWIVRAIAGENQDLVRATILSVEDQPYTRFIKPALELISGETLAFKATWLTGWARPSWWAMSHLLDHVTELHCRFMTPGGQSLERTLPTVGFREYEKLIAKISDTGGPTGPEGTRFLDHGAIGVFTFPAFDYTPEETARVDQLFHTIEQRHSKALIMDIRGNGGGNSAIGDYIVSYLTDKPYRTYSAITSKITPEVLRHRQAWWSLEEMSEYRELLGLTVTEKEPLEKPEPRKDRFHGRFILLTDNGTFSSATDFACVVKAFGLGTIIGRETGGVATSFGDVIYVTLPYSGVDLAISYRRFSSAKPQPGDDTHGVIPDIAVTDALLAKYRTAKDPVLALALDVARHGERAMRR